MLLEVGALLLAELRLDCLSPCVCTGALHGPMCHNVIGNFASFHVHLRMLIVCLCELQALNKAQEPPPAWLLSASISDGFALSDMNDVPIEAMFLKIPLHTDFL